MSRYLIGKRIRLSITITLLETGAAADPETLTLSVRNLTNRDLDTYTYGAEDGVIVKDGTGQYHADLTPSSHGAYAYRWATTGNIEDAQEDRFVVLPSSVISS